MYSENRQLEEYNHHGMRVNAPSIGCGLSLLYGYRCLAIPLAWIDGSSHAFIIFSVLGGQMEQLENYVFHIP